MPYMIAKFAVLARSPHVARDLVDRHAVSSAAVATWMSSPGVERLEQRRVLRQVRLDAQLDLAVVGGEHLPAGLAQR